MNQGSVSGIGNVSLASWEGASFHSARVLNLASVVLDLTIEQNKELTSHFPLVRDAGLSQSIRGAKDATTIDSPQGGKFSGLSGVSLA